MSISRIQQMKENTKELNILVVEDNTLFHKMYEKMLGGYFKSYTTAMDGLEGLKLFKEKPHFYDIIISDHQMPKMDGLEMTRAIKEIRSDAHVVFITGTSDINILSEVSLLSIDAILIKPLKKLQLLSVLDDVATKLVEKRHMQLYIEQLESMNQAIWNFKDKLRKELKRLDKLPRAKTLQEDLMTLINTPVSLMDGDNNLHKSMDININDEIEEEFDVEKAMQAYKEETPSNRTVPKEAVIESDENEHEGRFKDIRYSVVDKISAEEFVSEIDEGTFSELDDFREDLDNFNLLLNDMSLCEPSHFYGYLDQVVAFYHRLYKTVNSLVVFTAIENTFKEFATFIENIKREQLEDIDKQNMLIDALFALSDDLSKWINIIFYERNTDNIHYFDASFANTCLEIEAMFNEVEAEAVEDDEELLEFF